MINETLLNHLRRIWEDALEVTVTDIDADFFDLGGDSLLALLVANRAIENGITLPRSAVLRRPTLRQLTEAVNNPALFDAAW